MRLQLLLAFVLFGCACAAVVRMKLEARRLPSNKLTNRHNRPYRLSNKGVVHDPLEYWCRVEANVSVGTPPQQLRAVVDLQVGHLLVIDASAHKYISYNNINTSASSTFESSERMFGAKIHAGRKAFTASGTIGRDTITLGSPESPHITVTRQLIGYASSFSNVYENVLGLAFPAASADGLYPPLSNAIDQGQLDKPIFSLYLAYKVDGSMLTYGGLDTENCESAINYVPLSTAKEWAFKVKSVNFGSYSSNIGWNAMVSSSTDFILGPPSVIEGIMAAISAWKDESDYYLIGCNAMLPEIEFSVGSFTLVVKPEQLAHLCHGSSQSQETAILMNSIVASGYTPAWTLGYAFMADRCVIHDIGMQRIGFAEPKNK